MWPQVRDLESFAAGVVEDGYKHVVLLGMGGSALGPDVLRRIMGASKGFPELLVLDSTVPSAINATLEAIELSHSLFLVSSKSGTTLETLSLYEFFRAKVEEVVGKDATGERFVAITDPGTPLVDLGREQEFRRVFLNPPDIGGRYSVLSYFGLVPAALAGYNLERLLDQSDIMRRVTGPDAPIDANPAAWLGAIMASMAMEGRDKLTLAASPTMEPFGAWVEQMLAESSGKEGSGVIPVMGEPVMAPGAYGGDRLFIHLRSGSDETTAADAALGSLARAGHPVVGLDIADAYALGAEFFCWEMATAIACGLLGVNPFDQPNVQEAKDRANLLLKEAASRPEPETESSYSSVKKMLEDASPRDYLAVLAYLPATRKVRSALTAFRCSVAEKYRIATCLGYGPGYLHSTGQLFKGGPPKGHFIFITSESDDDIPIPGRDYTFGALAERQALGDMEALQSRGRPVVRIHLSGLADGALEGLGALLEG
jgi:glucose-6-phosphate isomerase